MYLSYVWLLFTFLHFSGANYSFHKEKAKPAEPIAPVVSEKS